LNEFRVSQQYDGDMVRRGRDRSRTYKFRLKVNRTTGNKELASDDVTFVVQ
jgi:hypothetical protein